MPKPAPSSPRRTLRLTLTLLALTAGLAAGLVGWLVSRSNADRGIASELAAALLAPRFVLDGRTIEARFDLAVEDLAFTRGTTAPAIRAALDRHASGGWLGVKRTGYDAFLAQLASRRFETAIVAIREVATLAKSSPDAALPAWRLLAASGVLEFSRGRIATAEPMLQQAFDLANRASQLDTPEAASLLTACGAVPLARGRPADAEPYLRRAASILARTPGADLRDRARVLTHFAQSIAAQGFPEEADPLCAEALALAAQDRRSTGRPDAAFADLEQNYRKILRERGLADAEIATRLRSALEPR